MDDPQNIAHESLKKALLYLIQAKPTERSEVARRYAVTITEVEKALAYFETWIINEMEKDE